MKTIARVSSLLLLALLVFLPLQSAAASGGVLDGEVIFGQSFTLASGETMDGDLVVFGGSATIEEGAKIIGSAILFGGNLTVDGTVNGDVAVTGGKITLGPTAHVTGNLTTIAASLDRADGSKVDGQVFNTATSWVGDGNNVVVPPVVVPPVVVEPSQPVIPEINFDFHPFASVLNAFGQSLALAVLAMLVMLFLAPQADRVAHAVLAQPLTAGGLGLLTTIAVPAALVALVLVSLLIVTLIFTVPLFIVILIAFGIAALFGWIALGYEAGQRFTKAIHKEWHPAFSAGLGTFALTLAAQALSGIPVLNCVGWLAPFLLGMAALGAVLMTRFGTQAVTAPVAPPPAAPPADAPGQPSA